MRLTLALLLLAATSQAQWQIQQSNTTADLRGIHSLGNGVAWASGSKGSVVRTIDNGKTWLACAVPPGAEALDFRGIQAFDAKAAIVMSAGKGDLSRLYKTEDGCKTWRLLFSNPDAGGFWDAIQFLSPSQGFLLGDPVFTIDSVKPHVFLSETQDGGRTWKSWHDRPNTLAVDPKLGIFAASNSAMVVGHDSVSLVTGGSRVALYTVTRHLQQTYDWGPQPSAAERAAVHVTEENAHISSTESSGFFAIAQGAGGFMIVGGNYKQPNSDYMTAVFAGAGPWSYPANPPHGYRSSVAYAYAAKTWITVGPNGTDSSTDNGLQWRALRPGPQGAADEDQNWNALSLPFVVGPHGRIGLLRPEALQP